MSGIETLVAINLIGLRRILILIILPLFSCENEKVKPVEKGIDLDSLITVVEFQQKEKDKAKWVEENILPRNELLINFSARHLTEEEIQSRSYINRGLTKTEFADSLVVSFYKRVTQGCTIYGNIDVKNDTIKLLYKDICSPLDKACKCGGNLKFIYVLKNTDKTKRKIYIEEERTLRIN